MKRSYGCIVLLGVLLVSGPASAKEMSNKLGVGFHQTLGGATGVGVKYWLGKFGILGNVSFDVWSPESPEDGDTRTTFILGAGAVYNLFTTQEANLGIGLLLDLGLQSQEETAFQIAIESPVIAEYFFSDHFSIYGQVGLVINIVPEEGAIYTPDQGSGTTEGVGFTLGVGTGAAAGFTFYF